MTEIRWHGRGGQGVKSIAEILALALLKAGWFVQAFPEYGPERSGAPVRAFTRLDRRPVRLRCAVTEPDYAVILDAGLLEEAQLQTLKPGGTVLLNSSKAPEDQLQKGLAPSSRLVWIDAGRLAQEAGGRHPNMVVLGALAALLGEPDLPVLREAVVELFGSKWGALMESNLKAIEAGFKAGQGTVKRREGSLRFELEGSKCQPRLAQQKTSLKTYKQIPIAGVVLADEVVPARRGGWRSGLKPVVHLDRCVNCLLCWLNCPDTAVLQQGAVLFGFDYDYCKGCELCEEVCPSGAIEMVGETIEVPVGGRIEGGHHGSQA